MTKFLSIYLMAVIWSASVYSADDGSPVKTAGAKRRTSDMRSVDERRAAEEALAGSEAGTAGDEERPTTPVGRGTRPPFSKWTLERGFHTSPGKAVPTPLRDELPDGLDTAYKRVRAMSVVKEAGKLPSPERVATVNFLQGMLNAEASKPLLHAAKESGVLVSPKAAVVRGLYQAQAASKQAHVGVKKGQVPPPQLFDLANALIQTGHTVTPAADVAHMSGAPKIENNGTLTGGHSLDDYEKPPFTLVEKVDLVGHVGACAIAVSYDSGRKGELIKGKTVWRGDAASEDSVAERILGAEIIGTNSELNKHLLQCHDGACIGFLKGPVSYGSFFPTRFIRQHELAEKEIVLGHRDGSPVVVSSDELIVAIKEHAAKNVGKLTIFRNASGGYVLSGIAIPGLPSGGSVELTSELAAECKFPDFPYLVSPVKAGTPCKLRTLSSGGSAGSSSRVTSPMRRMLDLSGAGGGAGDFSVSVHELH